MKSSPSPGLPTWLFILTDLALLGTAAIVAWTSPLPLSTGAVVAIVACVLLGVLVGLVPLVARLERQKNEALDQRQRALEALAETVRESAQQVSIATGSLNGIAEIARRTLREAEELPEKLQQRVSAFQSQLAEAEDGARAALEEEIAALRTSELGRIEAALNQLARTATELTRLETAAAKQVAALQREAADSAAKLERVLAAAREGSGTAREVHASRSARAAEGEVPRREASRKPPEVFDPGPDQLSSAPPPAAPTTVIEAPISVAVPPQTATPAPRKPRRPRREEAAEAAPAEAAPAAPPAVAREPKATVVETAPAAPAPGPSPAVPEPLAPAPKERPVVAATPSEPVKTAEPEQQSPAPGPMVAPSEPELPPPAALPRKRAARRPEPEPALELGIEDSSPGARASVERTLTSDGATRLLATAYIGIGNRLFIRGEGPGLSWERGVPLQFISIGKWRWETAEAGGPIRFRLYKNDELECSALGEQVLDPGYLQEVTASF